MIERRGIPNLEKIPQEDEAERAKMADGGRTGHSASAGAGFDSCTTTEASLVCLAFLSMCFLFSLTTFSAIAAFAAVSSRLLSLGSPPLLFFTFFHVCSRGCFFLLSFSVREQAHGFVERF